MQCKLLTIKTRAAQDAAMGTLSVFEAQRDIPFEIKRVYYIQGAKAGVRRGHHAHKALWQILFCPYGSLRVDADDGVNREAFILDDPSKALLMGPGVWHTMDWLKDDSLLCVVASDYYDESDYMRDYSQFTAYMKGHPELV